MIKERLQAGVKVVIVADAFGSLGLKKEAVNELRTAGAEFLFFSQLLRRTHRKILIVDEKIAFLGGVNINQKIIEGSLSYGSATYFKQESSA